MSHPRSGLIRQALAAAVLVAAAIGLCLQFHRTWPGPQVLRLKPIPAFLACVCAMAGLLCQGALWQRTLRRLGNPLSLAIALRVWFLSQMTRYIPGGAWSYLARPHLAARFGVPPIATAFSLAAETLQTLTASLLVIVATLPSQRTLSGLIILASSLPLAAFYARPDLFHGVISRILTRGTAFGPGAESLRLGLLALLPGYCAIWLIHGTGLFCLAWATQPVGMGKIPALSGMFALAWAAGFLCVLAPSGLGVRELVLSGLLTLLMPPSMAVIMALLWRFALTLAEVACTASVIVLTRDASEGSIQPDRSEFRDVAADGG